MPRRSAPLGPTGSFAYQYHYLVDRDTVRIWKPTWFGDQFEVLSNSDFELFKQIGERIGVTFTAAIEKGELKIVPRGGGYDEPEPYSRGKRGR